MSIYLNTEQLTLRIFQIQKRLGELSSTKEKIAFKFFNSEPTNIKWEYINKYSADAEKQYNINKLLAIDDINKKVCRYQSELTELESTLFEQKKIDAEKLAFVRRLVRNKEIERMKEGKVNYSEMDTSCELRFVPAFHHASMVGGFLPIYSPNDAHIPISSTSSRFITPAHVLKLKTPRF